MPLNARVMALFDNVEGKEYQFSIENIYNSVTFFKGVYNHKKNVLTRGVTRKETRGIPPWIKQHEFNSI